MRKKKSPPGQCLLIKTPDERIFFTHENNYPILIEFGKTFSAEISVVEAPQAKILELEELCHSICSQPPDPAPTQPEYKVIKLLLSAKDVNTKIKARQDSEEVKTYIKEELLKGNLVRVADLLSKWSTLSRTTISRQLRTCTHDLGAQGFNIVRVKPGQYRVRPLSDLAWG